MSFDFNSDVNRVSSDSSRLLRSTQRASKVFSSLSNSLSISSPVDYSTDVEISDKKNNKIKDYSESFEKAQTAINIIKVADNALSEIKGSVSLIKELAKSATDDKMLEADREKVREDIDKNIENIDKIAKETSFENELLLDGSSSGKEFLIDSNTSIKTEDSFKDASSSALGLVSSDVSTPEQAKKVESQADSASKELNKRTNELDKVSEKTTDALNKNEVATQNIISSTTSTMSIDTAKELSQLTQNEIVNNSKSSLSAQANQTPNIAIDLL